MRKADDSLSDSQRQLIRRHAELALREAGALGQVPTPIEDVMAAAKVVVAEEDALGEDFLSTLRGRAGKALRRAVSKVLGVLDAAARIIYLDKTVHVVQRTFLKLHETAHAILPWQRQLFVVAEECKLSIDPDVAEEFERQANCFASDVMFQLDSFTQEANDHRFGILVPVRLSKRYKASIYSSVRRYVSENARCCMVLILELPEVCPQRGYTCRLRRDILSPEFRRTIGSMQWPDVFTPDDQIGSMVPIGGRKMSRPREIVLVDSDSNRHSCIAEAFTQGHHIFVLIHSVAKLTRRTFMIGQSP